MAILIYRLGWHGIIIIFVIIAILPLQFIVGKINGIIIKNINIYKDKRVRICS